jgi:hypothetical protein
MEKHETDLYAKYPASKPCTCEICKNYCMRPGWWTVKEAARAIDAGYANRMMLEMAPDLSFGVLSPAFKGCEANFAVNSNAQNGCNFLKNELCELFGTDHQPLECRFCHHERIGQGEKCHLDLEKDWKTPVGQAVIAQWGKITGLWERSKNQVKK